MVGKWFREKVAKLLAHDAPELGRAAVEPIRQAEAAAAGAADTFATHNRDPLGERHSEQSDLGTAASSGADPIDSPRESSAVFWAGASAHRTQEGLTPLMDRRAAEVATLPVNYGLAVTGNTGVRLRMTTRHDADGYQVSGLVERLSNTRTAETVSGFQWKDPGDGAAPSWSVQLNAKGSRLARAADALPVHVAELAPGFDTARVRAAVTEAAEHVERHKVYRPGATLGVEIADDALHVRVGPGAPDNDPAEQWIFKRTVPRDES